MASLSVCQGCGAGVARGFDRNSNHTVLLEPTGFGATINKSGELFWHDTYRQHTCPPAAVASRRAWIEMVTTEDERKRAADLAAQREVATELALSFACPKEPCAAPVGERCINITVIKRTGEQESVCRRHGHIQSE